MHSGFLGLAYRFLDSEWSDISKVLEKRKIIQKHNMFTRTYIGTDNVQNAINTIVDEFKNKFRN